MRVLNNKSPFIHLLGLTFLSLFLMSPGLFAAEKEVKTDLRVLVDVSGSMKQNDPENLRRTALRLLIGLVPEQARVGIWTFGQYVNMQVKPDFASKAWKKNARVEAGKIHSLGLFTNIESTLDKSTWDWRKPSAEWDRHLILLTDGQVDISKDKNKNRLSRGKILKELLPILKAAGVKIHTIALSKNADHELLKTLSTESDAWYEPVESAERLQKVFLRLFEKSTPTDTVPLDGNRFEVDKSIEDMTLLVFHVRDARPTRIIRPDNSSFQYGQAPKNISWHHDKGFDLITVHKPETGSWSIDAEIDKDNRVQVVTNLKLRVGDIPNNILRSEALNIIAELKENDGLVSNKEILDLVDINVVTNQADITNSTRMKPADKLGSYMVEVAGLDKTGAMELTIRAIGPTFRRESHHSVRVHESPLQLDVSENENSFLLTVTENPDLIQTGTLQLALQFEGDKSAYRVLKAGAHSWQAIVGREYAGRKLSVQAKATLIGGRALSTQLHNQLPEAEVPFVDPLTIWAEEHDGKIVVQVLETSGVLQTGTLDVKLLLADSEENKATNPRQLLQIEPGLWRLLIDPAYSENEVTIQASAHILSGKPYQQEHKLILPKLEQPVVEHKDEDIVEEKLVKEDPVKEELTDLKEEPLTTDDEKHGRNWVLIIIILLLINGLIGGAGFFAYRYWKKRDNQVDDALGEEEQAEEKIEKVVEEDESISFDEDVDVIGESSGKKNSATQEIDKTEDDFSDERRPQPAIPAVDLSESAEADLTEQVQDDDIPTLTETAAGGNDEAVADEWAAALNESGDAPTEEVPAVEPGSDEAVADEWAAALSESGDAPAEEATAVEPGSDEAVADEWAAALNESGDAPTEEVSAVEPGSDEAVADEWAVALSESGDVPAEEATAVEPGSDEAVADEWAAALLEAGALPDGTVDEADTDKLEENKK